MLKRLLFASNPHFEKYFSNTAWILLEKALRVVDGFFIGIWLARYLGPADFGTLSYATSFVYLFAGIAALGLDQIVVRELVKKKSDHNEILGTTLGLKFFGFTVMFILMALVIHFLNNDAITNTLIYIFAIGVGLQSFKGVDLYFQSEVLSKHLIKGTIFAILIIGVAKIILILTEAPLLDFGIAITAEWLIILCIQLIAYTRLGKSIVSWKFQFSRAKALLGKSWVLIIGAISASLYMKIDQVMIKEILGLEAVGVYSVAVKLTGVWLFVTAAITQSVFPSLVHLRKADGTLYLKRLQQLYDVLLKIAVVVSVLYNFFASYFVPLLFGAAYKNASSILVLYIWSIVFVYLSNASWGYYLNENLEKLASIRLVIGAIINICLNLVLIENYGLQGAAYATLISYAISGYLINVVFKSTRLNFRLQSRAFLNILNLKTWRHPL